MRFIKASLQALTWMESLTSPTELEPVPPQLCRF